MLINHVVMFQNLCCLYGYFKLKICLSNTCTKWAQSAIKKPQGHTYENMLFCVRCFISPGATL